MGAILGAIIGHRIGDTIRLLLTDLTGLVPSGPSRDSVQNAGVFAPRALMAAPFRPKHIFKNTHTNKTV